MRLFVAFLGIFLLLGACDFRFSGVPQSHLPEIDVLTPRAATFQLEMDVSDDLEGYSGRISRLLGREVTPEDLINVRLEGPVTVTSAVDTSGLSSLVDRALLSAEDRMMWDAASADMVIYHSGMYVWHAYLDGEYLGQVVSSRAIYRYDGLDVSFRAAPALVGDSFITTDGTTVMNADGGLLVESGTWVLDEELGFPRPVLR